MEIINPETLAMLTALDPELAKAYAERCLNAPEPSQKEKEANKQTFVFNAGSQTVNVNCNFIEGKSSNNRKANSSNNASSNASSSSNKPGNPSPPAPPQQELTVPTFNQEEADALEINDESGDLIDEDEVNEVDTTASTTTSSSLDPNDLNRVPDFIT